jgi:hypothetical protein
MEDLVVWDWYYLLKLLQDRLQHIYLDPIGHKHFMVSHMKLKVAIVAICQAIK